MSGQRSFIHRISAGWRKFTVLALTAGLLGFALLTAGGALAQPPTRIVLEPQSLEFPRLGMTRSLQIQIQDAPELVAADIYLAFDPARLQVVDADPTAPGIQIARGTFPDPAQGFVINTANNSLGLITYSVTLLSPPPASGSGLFAAVVFQAVGSGSAGIEIITQTNHYTRTGLYAP
ncbi:MAG: cohesin domain-containing protein, partial [Anaerolineae bacterium]